MIYSIVYISSSAGLMTDSELQEILVESRIHNAKAGITGVLMYCNGNILQVLEGEEDQVMQTYHRISKDFRHNQVTKLFAGLVNGRSFDIWSMGYKTLSSNEMDGLRNALPFIDNPYRKMPADQIMALIQTFYIHNHRN